jgi:putative transposon-encoded protein
MWSEMGVDMPNKYVGMNNYVIKLIELKVI